MSPAVSLGVLLPTRNSAALLPQHLAAMAAWLDLAEQVVVVDSFSSDGTEQILQAGLKHPHVAWLKHPPGLYASWNAGLHELRTTCAYISTVGDTISRQGMMQLMEAAVSLDADVVISKPEFRMPDGAIVHEDWPVDDIVRTLVITAPRRLSRLEAMIFASVHVNTALTGSCASDLFRTSVLHRSPFPTEFGTAGDGFWGLEHAAELNWAVVPGVFSTFLKHPTGISQRENQASVDLRRDELLRVWTKAWLQAGVIRPEELEHAGWDALCEALSEYLDAKTEFDLCRKGLWPWFLNPSAWRARLGRQSARRTLDEQKRSSLGLKQGGAPAPTR